MSSTYVDTDAIEEIVDKLARVISRVEESVGVLQQTRSQMMDESIGLASYPQWVYGKKESECVLQRMLLLNERIHSLQGVLKSVPYAYKRMEVQHIQAIESVEAGVDKLPSQEDMF